MRVALPVTVFLVSTTLACASVGEIDESCGEAGSDACGGTVETSSDGPSRDEAASDGYPIDDGGDAIEESPVRDAFDPDAVTISDDANGGVDAPQLVDVTSGEDGLGADDAAAAPDALLGGDGSPGGDASSDTNIAPTGTGYTWRSMTSSFANTVLAAEPAVNDDNLTTPLDIDHTNGDSPNAWEAAGVTFASGHTIASVIFVQGTLPPTNTDGWFEANSLKLQFSTDGTTWADSGWAFSPAYSYSIAVSGKAYSFGGPPVNQARGARVVGQVHTTGTGSWWVAVNEVEVYGQ